MIKPSKNELVKPLTYTKMEKTELLKEIEQLKLNASPSEIAVWERMNKAEALNAELLEALKIALPFLDSAVNIGMSGIGEFHEPFELAKMEKVRAAIAKAEGKQIKSL